MSQTNDSQLHVVHEVDALVPKAQRNLRRRDDIESFVWAVVIIILCSCWAAVWQ